MFELSGDDYPVINYLQEGADRLLSSERASGRDRGNRRTRDWRLGAFVLNDRP